MNLLNALRSFVTSSSRRLGEAGASLVEYTLLVALIAGVAIAAITMLGTSAESTLCDTGNAIAEVGGTPDPDCDPATP